MGRFNFREKIKSFSLVFTGVLFSFGLSTLIPMVASAATFDQSGCANINYYDVGPGKQYVNLGDLPWSRLKGCDTVRVSTKVNNAPYFEKVLISAGTNKTPTAPNMWFRLQGIPDAAGNLPIISGKNSTQKETVDGQVQSLQYIDNNNAGRILYKLSTVMIWGQAGATYGKDGAKNIMIDHLDIRGASDLYSFTDFKTNTVMKHHGFASGIYGIGKHLIIKNNIITDNGNGIFINSKNDWDESTSEDLLFEGNFFTFNGRDGDFHEHHMYVQAKGPEIVQYNYFGMGRPGSHPQAYKTRSAGSVFRYNTVVSDPAEHQDTCLQTNKQCAFQQAIWYSEPDGSPVPIKADPTYSKSFVYGNVFVDKANGQGMLFTDRNAASTVYFYNNTYLAKRPKPQQQVLLFINPLGTKIEARNNIFASEPFAAGILPTPLVFEGSADGGGNVNLVNNLVTTANLEFWPFHHGPGSTTTVTGLASNIIIPNNDNSLVFNDFANYDFHLKAGSPAIGAVAVLDPAAIANAHLVQEEYVSLGVSKPRASAVDIGAFASGQGGAITLPQNSSVILDDGGDFGDDASDVSPVLSMVISVPNSTNNVTPGFTFNTTEGGTLQFSDACPVSNPANNSVVGAGNNMVVFGPLNVGNYIDCSITVTDVNNLKSTPLFIGNFQVVANNNNNNNNNNNGSGLSADGTCAGYLDVKNVDNCFMYIKLQQLGFFKPATYFYPNDFIDRSQALKLSEKLSHKFNENIDYCQNNTYYPDVKKGYDWAAQLICFQTQNQQVNGSNGYFVPYRTVNFAELSKMIGMNTSSAPALFAAFNKAIANRQLWFGPFINFMISNQIVAQSDFVYDGKVARWQAVKIFYALATRGFIQ